MIKLAWKNVFNLILRISSLTGIWLLGCSSAVENPNTIYMLALNSDGGRVAIAKWNEGANWELFEGALLRKLQKLHIPLGQYPDGNILYSADGKTLLYASLSQRPSTEFSTQSDAAKTTTTTVWQQSIYVHDESIPIVALQTNFGMTNILTLTDGSLVFMGKVDEVRSKSWSPITGNNRIWSEYKWMRWKPIDGISVISSHSYAFFAAASLIRDEAIFMMQERYVDGLPVNPRRYYVDITPLKPDVNLSDLERFGSMQDRRGGPRLQCDWAGTTCAKLTAYDKDGYYAHQLELLRDGKVCKVDGLPDRVEQMAISRNGNAMALITQATPRKSAGYKLAYISINKDGCADDVKILDLP